MVNLVTINVPDVIEALGGNDAVARLTGVKSNAVSQWKSRGRLPKDTYPVLSRALTRRRKPAPFSLWGMREPAARLGN